MFFSPDLKLYHRNEVTNWNPLKTINFVTKQFSRFLMKLLLKDYFQNKSNTFHLTVHIAFDCHLINHFEAQMSTCHIKNMIKISGFIDLWVLSPWTLPRKQTAVLLSLKLNLEWEMSRHKRNNSPWRFLTHPRLSLSEIFCYRAAKIAEKSWDFTLETLVIIHQPEIN